MERYEHRCPIHGLVLGYPRNHRPPVVPLTCPADVDCDQLRCGERLAFRITWDHQGTIDHANLVGHGGDARSHPAE